MNRYKSSSKLNKNFDNQIIFQDDFDNQLNPKYQEDSQVVNNPRYKSIPSKAALLQNLEQTNEHINPNEVEDIRIIRKEPSQDQIRLNNFFGSKKTLERRINSNTNLSSEYNPQTRLQRQVRSSLEDNTNDKLKEMIQKQIKDRERWQNIAQEKQKSQRQQITKKDQNQNQKQKEEEEQNHYETIESSPENLAQGTNPLIVINDYESYQRMNSKQKLTKVSEEKFAAINLQKNNLFENNNNENEDYINEKTQEDKQKKENQDEVVVQKKKKRTVTELRPLKKKVSTYEIMNQLDLVSKPSESQLISLAEDNNSMVHIPIKISSPKTLPKKTMNSSKNRIIGLDIKDFMYFAYKPVARGKYIQATVHRDRKCIDKAFFPQYCIQIDEVNVLYAKKTMKGYDILLGDHLNNISLHKMDKVGSVKGNFVGSYYNIFAGANQEQILATVFYNSQMTTKSAIRDVELYVRSSEIKAQQMDYGVVYNMSTNLKTLLHIGDNKEKIKKYILKQPIYDPVTGTYQMDFGTKQITMPSVKNVILINSQNPKQKVLIFGKCGYDNFHLRIENPMSPIVALGYLMTSFNFKWVTQ